MIYALTIICTVSGSQCLTGEDDLGPYANREACLARHEATRPIMSDLAALQALRWGEPVRIFAVCDTLERIRQVVPDAFDGKVGAVASRFLPYGQRDP